VKDKARILLVRWARLAILALDSAACRTAKVAALVLSPSPLRTCAPPIKLCRDGRLHDVERWIAEGKPLQVTPEAIRKGTRPKTALQIALKAATTRSPRCS